MNLRFKTDDSEDFYTLVKSNNFGWNLVHHTKSAEGSKREFSQHNLFYANLQQVADIIRETLESSNAR